MRILFTLKSLLFFFVFIVSVTLAHSQINEWGWMKGDSTANSTGTYGIQGIASSLNKPGARVGSCSWTDLSDNLWMFGGEGPQGRYNDLWNYNIATNEWTWMKGDSTFANFGVYGTQGISTATNKPPRRHDPVSWTDVLGNLWLFGGYTDTNSGDAVLNDMWKYNIKTNEWTWIKGDSLPNSSGKFGTRGVSSITNNPRARKDCISWNDGAGNLWLFGGFSYFSSEIKALSDLWKYNPSSNEWTWVNGDTIPDAKGIFGSQGTTSSVYNPGARFGCVSWSDNSGNLWLFGGRRFTPSFGSFNDLWKYNISSNQWTWMKGDSTIEMAGIYGTKGTESPLNNPGTRAYSVSWTEANNFWLFGGGGQAATSGGFLNDLWKYSSSTNNWTWFKGDSTGNSNGAYGTFGISALANSPGARQQGTSWKNTKGDLWLFGGWGLNGDFNDLWKYTPGINLPVTLISFTGNLLYDKIQLQWVVENEQNLDQYEIERSFDGIEFTKLNVIKANRAGHYTDNDNTNQLDEKRVYYRLKMIDKDGSFSYSPILAMQQLYNEKFSIYPNPATTSFKLRFDKKINGRVNVEITDVNGEMVVRKVFDVKASNVNMSTNNMVGGTYILKVIYKDQQYSQRIVIVK